MATSKLIIIATILTLQTSYCADDEFSPHTLSNTYGDSAANDSQITFSSLPKGKSYVTPDGYSQGSLAPLYKMATGFVNTIQPYDPAFMNELVKQLYKGNVNYVTDDIMGTAKNIAGIAACVVIGLIFILLMPLIAFCFCCCRCCGNCGGTRNVTSKQLEKANCFCCAYSIVVLILFLFLLTGSILVYKSGGALGDSLGAVTKTVITNIDDGETFLDNTVDEINHLTGVHFNFTVDVIGRDLDNIGYLVGVPIRTELKKSAGIDDVVNSIKSLDSSLVSTGSSMLAVNSSIAYVKSNATALSDALSTAKTNLDAALAQAGCAAGCSSMDTSVLKMNFNPDSMPDISSEVNQINDVMKVNLTERAEQGANEVETIPTRVKNETLTTVADIKKLLEDFKGTINGQIGEITKVSSEFSDSTKDIKKTITDLDDTIDRMDVFRKIATIVLASIVLLVALLQFLGLCMGICTYRRNLPPTQRSCPSNSAADFLMASVGFIFIFSWLLMLLTTITFLIGAPLKRYMCGPLTDPDMTLIKDLLDTPGVVFEDYFLGKTLLQNGSIPLTFSGLLLGCKNDKAAMDVMKLDALFDVNKVTDYKSSIDIDKQLDSINVDLSKVEIMSADTEKQLEDFRSAVDIDFAGFKDELDKNTTQANLTAFAEEVKALGDASTNPAQTALYNSATEIKGIDQNQYADTVTAQADLKAAILSLESAVAPISGLINDTINSSKSVDNYLNTTGSTLIKSEAKNFANRVLDGADQFVNHTKKLLYSDVGKCKPVWNLWNSLTNVLLCQQIVDALGGFWFSLGWSTFFMIVSSIFNVKLAKYFRTMKSVDSETNPLIKPTTDKDFKLDPLPKKKNKVAPSYDI